MNKLSIEILVYISIFLIIISQKFTYLAIVSLLYYTYKTIKKNDSKFNIFWNDIHILLNKNKRKKDLFIYLALTVLLASIIDWGLQFKLSSRIQNIGTTKILLYGFFGVTFFGCFNWNTPLLEYWRINFIDIQVKKNFKILYLNKLRDMDFVSIESFKKSDIYHIMLSAEHHLNESVKYLQYTYKYSILVIVAFFGICLFSLQWGIKMLAILYITNVFLILPEVLSIQEKKKRVMKNKIDISTRLNYLIDDFRNIIHYNKIKRKSLHDNFISKIADEESLLEKNIDDGWNFMLLKFLTITRFVYFATWINAINALHTMPIITTAFAIKTVMGISFSYKISSYANEVLLNFINYLKSVEDYKIIERTKYPNREIIGFIYKMKDKIKLEYPNIYLFNIKLNKKYVYITGESGKGKTSLLRSLFYLHEELWDKTIYIDQDSSYTFNGQSCEDFIMGFEIEKNTELVIKAIKAASLNKKFDRYTILKKPSGGESQRLKIARSLYQAYLTNPEVIIMDEPDTGLDYVTFKRVMKNIANDFPKTQFIFTSHKVNTIKELGFDIQTIEIP
jgi:ABC-type phosphate/phosphonate transport system ATPase subunit